MTEGMDVGSLNYLDRALGECGPKSAEHELSRISKYEEAREAAEWLIHSSWAAGARQNKLVEQFAKLDQAQGDLRLEMAKYFKTFGLVLTARPTQQLPEEATANQRRRLKQYQGVERRSSLKIEAILSGRQDLQDRVASELQYVLAVAEGQQVDRKPTKVVYVHGADRDFCAALFDVIGEHGRDVQNSYQDRIDRHALDTEVQLREKEEELKSLFAKQASLDFDGLQAQFRSLQQRNGDAERDTADLQRRNNSLLDQVSDLQQEKRQLQEEACQAAQHVQVKDEELQHAEQHKQTAVATGEDLRVQLQVLHQQCEALQHQKQSAESGRSALSRLLLVLQGLALLVEQASAVGLRALQCQYRELSEQKQVADSVANDVASQLKAKDAQLQLSEQQTQAAVAAETDVRTQLRALCSRYKQALEQKQATDSVVDDMKAQLQQAAKDSAAQLQDAEMLGKEMQTMEAMKGELAQTGVQTGLAIASGPAQSQTGKKKKKKKHSGKINTEKPEAVTHTAAAALDVITTMPAFQPTAELKKIQELEEDLAQLVEQNAAAVQRADGLYSKNEALQHQVANMTHCRPVVPAVDSSKAEKDRLALAPMPPSTFEQPPEVMDSDASTASEPSPAGSPDALLALRLQLSETRLQVKGLSLQKERLEVALAKTEAKLQMHDIGLTNNWQVGKELGQGASGHVATAVNPLFSNVVVKKGSEQRMLLEGEKLWVMNHTNVVRMLAIMGSEESQPDGSPTAYLILKQEGRSLASLYADPKHSFTAQQIIVGFQGLFAGIAHMHSKNVVDQDLHSGNVLLSIDGSCLIKADLGNAVWGEVDGHPTWVNQCMCTQGYEPPEVAKSCLQAGGYHPISSSDVFAGGQLLLEAVGGYQPQEQLDLQGTIAYRTEQEQGCFDPTQVPGQRKALEWLANLVDDPTKPDYANQVQFPSWLQGGATSYGTALRAIIKSCLHTASERRPAACQVRDALYAVMLRNNWSRNMRESGRKPRSCLGS